MQGGKRANWKDYLGAAERQIVAAEGTDTTTSNLLQRVARKYAQRALDALMAERGRVEPALIA